MVRSCNSQLAGNAVNANNIASGQVVKSLNGLTDAVSLSAGANVTITPSGNTLQIAASGGGGVVVTNTLAAGNNVGLFTNSGVVQISSFVPSFEVFNQVTNAVFSVPTNVTKIMVEMWGCGGNGGSGYNDGVNMYSGGGGGAGAYAWNYFTVIPGSSYLVTAPGALSSSGASGGTASFSGNGISMTASGGSGGGNATISGTGAGGKGGQATGGRVNVQGGGGDSSGNGGGSWRGGSGQSAGGADGLGPVAAARPVSGNYRASRWKARAAPWKPGSPRSTRTAGLTPAAIQIEGAASEPTFGPDGTVYMTREVYSSGSGTATDTVLALDGLEGRSPWPISLPAGGLPSAEHPGRISHRAGSAASWLRRDGLLRVSARSCRRASRSHRASAR